MHFLTITPGILIWINAAQIAGHSIQISSDQLVIDEVIKTPGTHELSRGVTVQYSQSSFTIRGPASESTGQRAEVKGYRKAWSKASMPTGSLYNLYALLPNSHSEAATGLCKGQETCAALFDANQFIGKASSLFSVAEVTHLNQVCCSGHAPILANLLLTSVFCLFTRLAMNLFYIQNPRPACLTQHDSARVLLC